MGHHGAEHRDEDKIIHGMQDEMRWINGPIYDGQFISPLLTLSFLNLDLKDIRIIGIFLETSPMWQELDLTDCRYD
ncbi:MAG: hypothetical protein WD053_06000 [Gracilimonas sp.]